MTGPDISLRGFAIVYGEREMSAGELAALQQVSLEAVQRSLGDSRIFVTDQDSELELGVKAAKRCLEQLRLEPEAVDGIIWIGGVDPKVFRPTQYLQAKLGASNAGSHVVIETDCSMPVGGLQLARALLLESPDLNRILVIGSGVHGRDFPRRTLVPLAEDHHDLIYTDAAFALIVDRGPGTLILGFGNASHGQFWDHMRVLHSGTPEERKTIPTELQVMHAAKPLHRSALQRCLRAAGVPIEQIDHILFTREPGTAVERSLVRQMGLDPDRLFRPPRAPTHTGLSDQWIALEALLAGPGRPGQHVLVAARTYGMMRCAVLRLGSSDPTA